MYRPRSVLASFEPARNHNHFQCPGARGPPATEAMMEARVGFEPTNGGFADLSLRPLGYRAGARKYSETGVHLSVATPIKNILNRRESRRTFRDHPRPWKGEGNSIPDFSQGFRIGQPDYARSVARDVLWRRRSCHVWSSERLRTRRPRHEKPAFLAESHGLHSTAQHCDGK